MNIINIIIYLFILIATIGSTISFIRLNKIKTQNEELLKLKKIETDDEYLKNYNDVFATNSIIFFTSWFIFIIFLIYFLTSKIEGNISKSINTFLKN